MSDLVERLRERAPWPEETSPEMLLEAADALEAAQAQIKAARRETVEECAKIADEEARMWGQKAATVAAARIRALTEAKEDK